MIEHIEAVENLESILKVKGLDAILVGPYDLSASMGITGKFQEQIFSEVITKIRVLSNKFGIPFGMHVVAPQPESLQEKIKDGYQFIAYSIDAVFMSSVCQNPISNLPKTKVK
jgi:2-dehydro-3-deoxyglucarate aldolase